MWGATARGTEDKLGWVDYNFQRSWSSVTACIVRVMSGVLKLRRQALLSPRPDGSDVAKTFPDHHLFP